MAGATGDVLPELVARVEHDAHLLRGQVLARSVGSKDEGAAPGARGAALEGPGRRGEPLTAVGDRHVGGGRLEDLLKAVEAPGPARAVPEAHPGDAQGEVHLERPEALAHEEIASILFSLSFAGHETTNYLIGNLARRLLEEPERWDASGSSSWIASSALAKSSARSSTLLATSPRR